MSEAEVIKAQETFFYNIPVNKGRLDILKDVHKGELVPNDVVPGLVVMLPIAGKLPPRVLWLAFVFFGFCCIDLGFF